MFCYMFLYLYTVTYNFGNFGNSGLKEFSGEINIIITFGKILPFANDIHDISAIITFFLVLSIFHYFHV